MNINKSQLWTFTAMLTIVAMLLTMLIGVPQPITAAPLGAVTPVTFSNNGLSASPRVVTFFNGTPAAYNTPVTNCFDTRAYNTLDLVYTLGSVAAITVEQVYGNDSSVLAPGASLIANNATPVVTPAAVQIPNFNAFNCIKVTSLNGTPIAVYAKALAK